MKERLKYIDNIKGAAILFVVYFHLLLRIPFKESISAIVFESLCMPLFFFVSGKFAKRINQPQTTNIDLLKICFDKVQYVLLPTILCFIIAVISTNTDFSYWITQESKLGYWFTYTLFFIFILHAGLSSVLKALSLGRFQWIILSTIGCILYFLQFTVYQHDTYNILQALSVKSVMKYYVFFAMGSVVPNIPVRLIQCIYNKYVFLLAMILAFYVGSFNFIDAQGIGWYFKNCMFLLRSFSLILLVYLFFKNSSFLNAENRISRLLQLFGRKSIIIYFLHFYFLIRIPFLRELIDQVLSTQGVIGEECAFIIEFVFCLPVACLISLVCVGLGSILCQSSLVSRFLFGQKEHFRS